MTDFWIGVLIIPIGALAAAIVFAALVLAAYAYWNWGADAWRAWTARDARKRARIAAVVAASKVVRSVHLPGGFRLVYCRDKIYRDSARIAHMEDGVMAALRDGLKESGDRR